MGTITVKVGDILEAKAQTIVNTVNCVGVMGKGIALEFKKRFPEMYEDYGRRCRANQVRLGEPYLYKYAMGPWILNFPTKGHWRTVSRQDDPGLEYAWSDPRQAEPGPFVQRGDLTATEKQPFKRSHGNVARNEEKWRWDDMSTSTIYRRTN